MGHSIRISLPCPLNLQSAIHLCWFYGISVAGAKPPLYLMANRENDSDAVTDQKAMDRKLVNPHSIGPQGSHHQGDSIGDHKHDITPYWRLYIKSPHKHNRHSRPMPSQIQGDPLSRVVAHFISILRPLCRAWTRRRRSEPTCSIGISAIWLKHSLAHWIKSE